MARLSSIDIGFQGSLDYSNTWSDAGVLIPYHIFDAFTKVFCPITKCGFRSVMIYLGFVRRVLPSCDTLNFEVPFILERYCSLNTSERNENMLSIIEDVLVANCHLIGIPIDSVNLAANAIRENGYRWCGFVGIGMRESPDRSHRAKLWLDFGDTATLTLKVLAKKKVTQSIVVFTRPVRNRNWINSICSAFHRIEWKDDHTVLIYKENERDFWSINLNDETVEFHFPRAENGGAQGAYDLGQLYLAGTILPKNIDLALYWIRISASKGYKHAIRFLARAETDRSFPQEKKGD